MHKRLLSVILLFGFLIMSGPVYCQEKIMPVSMVKAGMKGYGKTVFKGTRVETFPFTVLGTVKKFLAESDIILIRLDGGYPVDHKIGIIAGMSGSPMYIDGKLIGAISLGWSFSKEPIAGVTPIESMFKELPRDAALSGSDKINAAQRVKKNVKNGKVGLLPHPIYAGGRKYTGLKLVDKPSDYEKVPAGMIQLCPAGNVLQVSGFSSRGLSFLKKRFSTLGFSSIMAPGGAGAGNPDVPESVSTLVPGSAVGVQLLSGDLEMSGTGTLTWRSGQNFLAFGHPMLELGRTRLPLTASYIEDILPSYSRSFKMATQIKVVGELSEDRLWAVSGKFHVKPPMIPVEIVLKDSERKVEKSYHMRSCLNPLLTPEIIGAAIMDSVSATSALMSEKSARVYCNIELKGQKPVVIEGVETGVNLGEVIAIKLYNAMQAIYQNDFAKVDFESVKIRIDFDRGRKDATVDKIYLNKAEFNPGDNMELNVVIAPFGEEKKVLKFNLPLPASMEGPIKIGICGGINAEKVRKKMLIPEPEARNLEQFLTLLRHREKTNQLMITICMPSKGAYLAGEFFPFIPQDLVEIIGQSPYSDSNVDRNVEYILQETPWYIKGGEVIAVSIEKEKAKNPREKERPAPPAPESAVFSDKILEPLIEKDAKKPVTPAAPASPHKREKPLGTSQWDIREEKQLTTGKLTGTALGDSGEITLAPQITQLAVFEDPFIWSSAWDPERKLLYLGQGNTGRILRLDESGGCSEFTRLNEVAPTAMGFFPGGDILVGTSPGGVLYRVSLNGEKSVVRKFEEKYIWSILGDSRGHMFIATGYPGNLYEMLPSGVIRKAYSTGQMHIRSLAVDSKGVIYIGTSDQGVVYKMEGGNITTLFETTFPSVESILIDKAGTLYASAGDAIYQLKEGKIRIIKLQEKAIPTLWSDDAGNILAGTHPHGRLYRISPDCIVTRYFEGKSAEIYNIICTGTYFWLVGSNPGAVWKLMPAFWQEGKYESDVLDSGALSKWGLIRWLSSVPEGTSLSVQTRSGNTEVPDGTWSSWSIAGTNAQGEPINSPPARYLQFRLNLSTRKSNVTPSFSSTSIFYRNIQQEPVISLVSPQGGEYLGGKIKVEWKVQARDIANIKYNIFYSGDGGATWQSLASQYDAKGRIEGKATDKSGMESATASVDWDTANIPDARAIIKIVGYWVSLASESYPEISKPFFLCNTPPVIEITKWELKEKHLVVTGFVSTKKAMICNISCRVDKEEPNNLLPEKGMYDSNQEMFKIDINLKPGAKALEIKALDEAGNTKTLVRNIQ